MRRPDCSGTALEFDLGLYAFMAAVGYGTRVALSDELRQASLNGRFLIEWGCFRNFVSSPNARVDRIRMMCTPSAPRRRQNAT